MPEVASLHSKIMCARVCCVRACMRVCVVIVCARLENTFPMYVLNTLDNKAVLCLMSYVLSF
jgi:hypothetical protein